MNETVAKTDRWMTAAAVMFTAATTAVGAAGILGWLAGNPLLVSLSRHSFPLQFNTAVCVFLLGLGVGAAVFHRRLIASTAAGLVFVIAALSAIEVVAGRDLGIGRMFVEGAGAGIAKAPLAPNTTISLLLCAPALLALAVGKTWRAARTPAVVLASCTAAISMVPLSGYVMGLTGAYQWGHKTPMSLPAALGVFACSMAVISATWRLELRARNGFPQWLPAAALAGLATASSLLFSALQLDASLTQNWSEAAKRSVRINTLATFACGIATAAALAVALLLARRSYLRSRELQELNSELDSEIAQRRIALAAVQTERRRLRDVLDAIPGYVVLLTRDYQVPFANRYFEQRFGKAEGRHCYEYLFGRDCACENCESFKGFDSRAEHSWEWKGPDARDYAVYDFPFTDTDGSSLVMELGLDITERKAAEEKLAQLNRALRLVSACDQALAHATSESELLQNVCELAVEVGGNRFAWIGYAERDERKTVRAVAKAGASSDYVNDDLVTWADEPKGRGPTGTAIRTSKPVVCADTLCDETFLTWRDRAVQFGFRSSLVVPLLHGGEAFGALSIYAPAANAFDQDEVSLFAQLADDLAFGIDALRSRRERKRAEAAVQASEERYRCLAVATAQIVWLTDSNGLVHSDMPMWREFTGMNVDQIQGWGWLDSLHPEDREHTAQVWAEAVERRALYETEYRIRRADNEYRHMWVRGVPVLEKSGGVREWVGTCTDITERKHAQEILARYAEELQRSNSELQEFAFVASHDLQEPLRKITAFSERLRDRVAGQLDETALDYLNRMHNSAGRMSNLINSLLEYSRLATRALPFEDVDLATICVGVVADLEQRIRDTRARVRIHTLPHVLGDPIQLRQLLQNLLANALKFHAPGALPEISVFSMRLADRWEICVADNGIGFDPQFTERIFRPFQRLHGRNEYEGSGMGLAICRKIAQRHGASIRVETAPGRGATFIVSLRPVATQTAERAVPAAECGSEPMLLSIQH